MRVLAVFLVLLLAPQVASQSPLGLTPGQLAAPLREHVGVFAGGPDRFEALPRDPARYAPVASLYPEDGDVPEAYWMRASVRSAADRPARWILPLAFDDVMAVLVRSDGTREVSRTGLRVPLVEQTLPRAGAPSIRFTLAPRETATLFVRVRHSANSYGNAVDLRAVDSVTLAQQDRRGGIWNGLFLGVLLALAVYNAFLYAVFRDRSYLYYVLFLFGTAGYWADTWGYVAAFVWPATRVAPFEIQFFALVLAATAYVQFARSFLRSPRHAPRTDVALRLVTGAWAVAAVLGLSGQWQIATDLAAASGVALLTATFTAAIVALRAGYTPARGYLLASGQFVLVGVLYSGSFLISPTLRDPLLPVLQASMLIEALGFGLALAVRIQTLRTERADAVEARRRAEETGEVLREASDLKTHLLGITAHDLRSPLTSIAGAASLVASEIPDRPDLHELTDLIERGSARMLALIDDLLVTAALDGGQIELHRAETNLAALAADVVSEYRPRAGEKGQTLDFERPTEALDARLDATRVQAILDNLVSNAVKYTPPGGRVAVVCEARAGEVCVRIADSGPGLSPDDQERLFERFRPLTPRPTGGESSTGLGLSIANEFARLHGGRIDVESKVGVGTTFTLVLPTEAHGTRAASERLAYG